MWDKRTQINNLEQSSVWGRRSSLGMFAFSHLPLIVKCNLSFLFIHRSNSFMLESWMLNIMNREMCTFYIREIPFWMYVKPVALLITLGEDYRSTCHALWAKLHVKLRQLPLGFWWCWHLFIFLSVFVKKVCFLCT